MEAALDHNSPVPLHIQVEKYLRELITREEYRNGSPLPDEIRLSKQFGISRNTFRAAMNRLVLEGLVLRKRGVGSRVNTARITTTLTEWDSFSREMTTKGKLLRTISKKIKWVEAKGEEAAALSVEPGTVVCRLERIKGVDGEPVVLFLSYFHPRVGIKRTEEFSGKLYDLLRDEYASVPEISDEEIGALPCDGYFRRKLNIPSRVPVLFRKRKTLNAAQKILELCYAYYRSDRFVYSIRIRKGDVR
jgi:GntR family transcriptional regulator